MSVIFGGGETPSFTSFNTIEDTTAGHFNVPARCAMHVSQGGWIKTVPLPSRAELWFHMDVSVGIVTASLVPITILDLSGNVLFSITAGGNILVGSTPIGAMAIFAVGGVSTIDLHIRSGTSGLIEIYVNSQVLFSVAGSYTTLGNMGTLMLSAVGQNSTNDTETYWSQVIIADEITIGFQLATLGFVAAGTNTGWSGPVTAINETVLDNTTYINAATASLTNTYTTTGVSTAYTNIKAVIITALARYSTAGGPTNLYADAFIASNNYTQAMNSIGIGYSPAVGVMNTNPATNAAWTPTDINGAEFGITSRV